jgi:hypothetical protein
MSVVKMNLDDNEDLRKETYLEEIAARDPPPSYPSSTTSVTFKYVRGSLSLLCQIPSAPGKARVKTHNNQTADTGAWGKTG